jgi:hypothetical protein
MRSTESVDCIGLPPGSLVVVKTENRIYRIECLGGSAVRISGHPEYCPTPVPGLLQGSTSEGDSLQAGIIECGRRVRFLLDNQGPLITTKVMSVRVEYATAAPMESSVRHAA